MKAMYLAFVAIAAIAWGAHEALERVEFSTADRSAGPSVRLGD